MFEQSLFATENEEVPEVREGDLFSNYEVKSWELSKRIYQILGASAFVNILALLIFAQTSLLTMKGCDSPLVGQVCQALDTVYVGAMLFGTEREYVDAAYDKTDLGEMEITYVDVSNVSPKLYYPSDYMKYSDPERYAMLQAQAANPTTDFISPGIPSASTFQRPQFGGGLSDTVPNPPKPKSDVVDGDLPGSIDEAVADTKPGLNKKRPGSGKVPTVPDRNPDGSIPGIPGSGTNPTVDPNVPKEPLPPGTINKAAFKDLALEIIKLQKANGLTLDTPFLVTAKGRLNKDGKIDRNSFKYGKSESSDKNMLLAVRRSIETFNDSGFLFYVSELSGKTLDISLKQDQQNISATVRTLMESDMRATSTVGILKLSKQLALDGKVSAIGELEAALAAEKDPVKNAEIQQKLQNTKDDLALLSGVQIGSDGKNVVIGFSVDKTAVHEMLNRKLDAEAKVEGDTVRPEANSNTAKK